MPRIIHLVDNRDRLYKRITLCGVSVSSGIEAVENCDIYYHSSDDIHQGIPRLYLKMRNYRPVCEECKFLFVLLQLSLTE